MFNVLTGGGGGGSRDCFKCGEAGHMARDCPNPGSGGRGKLILLNKNIN